MQKIQYDRDTYFVGKNGIYLDLTNTREYIDEDGIKRIVVEIKDPKKIKEINKTIEFVENYKKRDIENIEDIPDVL